MDRHVHKPNSLAFLIACGLLLLIFAFKALLIAPPSVAATQAATGFDADIAVSRLVRILGDERPHPVDSPANDAVRERLLVEIEALGYTPVVRDTFGCRGSKRWAGMACARVRNVMFRTGPSSGPAAAIVSHYDSVPAGPGAADDGAGVSAALEIASLLRGRDLPKPVIFLFTDGEEAGLLGAASFVRDDPWAKDVAFAINMEARGTGGPAIMFQTSAPNQSDIGALAARNPRIIANSLAADIYRMLPNDTDATEFLDVGWHVLNFAIASPLARYHTPLDSLEYLEHASVGHMGGAALASLEGWLAQPVVSHGKAEAQVIYTDLLGRFLLVLPQSLGLGLLCAGLFAAGFGFVRAGSRADKAGGIVTSLLAPLLAVGLSGGLAFGALWLVDQVQNEVSWWTATPMAARALCYSFGLLGAGLGLWLARKAPGQRVTLAAWGWLLAMFIGLSFVSPGSMILAAPAAALLIIIIGLQQFVPRLKQADWLFVFPAIMLFILLLPILDFVEVGLGFEIGWVLAGLSALMAYIGLASVLGSRDAGPLPVIALAALSAASLAWAAFVPAHNDHLPRPLNVQHWHGGPINHWVLAPGGEAAPSALQAIRPFAYGPVPGADGERLAADGPAPSLKLAAPKVIIVSQSQVTGARRLALRIISDGADEVTVTIPKAAKLSQVSGGPAGSGGRFDLGLDEDAGLRCVGRSCSDWQVEVVVATEPTTWKLRAIGRGPAPEAEPLLKARPSWATEVQGGDLRVSTQQIRL